MPLKAGYAVLKGHVIDGVSAKTKKDHYSIHVVDDETDYRIAVNVISTAKNFGPDLFVYKNEDFQHHMLEALKELPLGRKLFKPNANAQERRDSGVALDFIRMNLFDRTEMQIVPAHVDGAHNDLNEWIDDLVQEMIGSEDAVLYVFGEPWINEQKKDKIFGFFPGNGVHDIHMNQGDLSGGFAQEDGLYQDGGLIAYLPSSDKYVAYFTKFQSESWHTDNETGHAIPGGDDGVTTTGVNTGGGGNPIGPTGDPDGRVRIIAAMVNPVGVDADQETVTLLNTTAKTINLTGWALVDRAKEKTPLSGTILKGGTLLIPVTAPMTLSNKGGIITLLNDKGIKVDGVSYTKAQSGAEGETITFA